MAFKFVILAAFVAAANAGLIGAPVAYSAGPVAYSGYAAPSVYSHGVASPALVSQQNNILRTPGNLGQVSTYSKTITTPYSSVSKSDVRVSNDALAYPGYAAPAYHGYAAPAYSAYAAPIAKVAAPVAYAAAPAYSAYAAPVARYAAAPAVAAHGSLLGVAYSAAPAVAHMTYSNGLGLTYAY